MLKKHGVPRIQHGGGGNKWICFNPKREFVEISYGIDNTLHFTDEKKYYKTAVFEYLLSYVMDSGKDSQTPFSNYEQIMTEAIKSNILEDVKFNIGDKQLCGGPPDLQQYERVLEDTLSAEEAEAKAEAEAEAGAAAAAGTSMDEAPPLMVKDNPDNISSSDHNSTLPSLADSAAAAQTFPQPSFGAAAAQAFPQPSFGAAAASTTNGLTLNILPPPPDETSMVEDPMPVLPPPC